MSNTRKPFAAIAIALAVFAFGAASANASPYGWGKSGIHSDVFQGD